MSRLEELVKELPQELHAQAAEYLEKFLLRRQPVTHELDLLQGCLADVYPGLSSVEVQHLGRDRASDGCEHPSGSAVESSEGR